MDWELGERIAVGTDVGENREWGICLANKEMEKKLTNSEKKEQWRKGEK